MISASLGLGGWRSRPRPCLGRIGLVGRDSSGSTKSRHPAGAEQSVQLQRIFLQRRKMRGRGTRRTAGLAPAADAFAPLRTEGKCFAARPLGVAEEDTEPSDEGTH